MTIRDIARECGVSVATVSRVINQKEKGVGIETRRRIEVYMEEQGYTPNEVARTLARQTGKIIGLLLPDITNPFNAEMAKGVEEQARKQGYTIILCDSNNEIEKEEQYLHMLSEYYGAGLIYNNFRYTDQKLLERFKIPCVLVDSDVVGAKESKLPLVRINNERAMEEMVAYLIDQGHRKIGVITGYEGSYASTGRLRGYENALKRHGIGVDERLIKRGDFRLNCGKKMVDALLKEEVDFTAICCFNDLMAIGVMERLEERDFSVPKDISVTGFDNTAYSRICYPRLTTVHQPTYEMGQWAAKKLIDLIEGKPQGQREMVLEHQLIKRKSVTKN